MEGMSNSDGNVAPESNQISQAEAARLSSSFCRTDSDASAFSEQTDETSSFASESPSPSHWLLGNRMKSNHILSRLRRHMHDIDMDDQELEEELMKKRFAMLMLGEDNSGGARGVCPAKAVSNAITNLFASVFRDYKKLEPLDLDSKATWKREMDFLLAPCDHIVDFVPTIYDQPDGQNIEVMNSVPRSDISSSLPALKILDALLLDIMDSFKVTEIKYAEPEPAENGEKWWHPIPLLPKDGLSEKTRRHLTKKHKSATQVFKAAKALNENVLADMDVPGSYIEPLPKSGKLIVGEIEYHYMTCSSKFDPSEVIKYLNIAGEHDALQAVDKLEAAMFIWRRKASCKDHAQSKSSWNMVRDLVSDIDRADKNTVLATRASEMIYCLKHEYPQLPQSSMDASKMDHNTDMGKAILEAYSRVLETLAYKICSMIEEILDSDKMILLE